VWRLHGAIELAWRKIPIECEFDCSSVGAYLGAPVELVRDSRQVVVFERLQVAPRNLPLL
jgi:hypothetical protein